MKLRGGGGGDICCGVYVHLFSSPCCCVSLNFIVLYFHLLCNSWRHRLTGWLKIIAALVSAASSAAKSAVKAIPCARSIYFATKHAVTKP